MQVNTNFVLFFQTCVSPSPSLTSDAETALPLLDCDHLDLSEAILAREATGSTMPLIKNELKYKIQKKRRDSGLQDLRVEYKEPEPEQVCANYVPVKKPGDFRPFLWKTVPKERKPKVHVSTEITHLLFSQL